MLLVKSISFPICSQIGAHIKHRVQELGHGCSALVTKAGALQCSPSDSYTKKELIECARRVSEKVTDCAYPCGPGDWLSSLADLPVLL